MPGNNEQQDWSKLKVVELKEQLKQVGLSVSGRKDELVQRLHEHYQAEPTSHSSPPPPSPPATDPKPSAKSTTASASISAAPSSISVPISSPPPPPPPSLPRVSEPAVGSSKPDTQLAIPTIYNGDATPEPSLSNGIHPRQDDAEQRELKRPKLDHGPSPHPVPELKQDESKAELPLQDAKLEHDDELKPAKLQEQDQEPPEYNFEPEDVDSSRPTDLYLDTINRHALDFDFERLCSVTLSQNNIYACLTDGKYFQGRGKASPAYAHSIAEDHHVYINLTTQKVYVLPDGYEVNDHSLDDIKYLLFPTFTPSLLKRIDAAESPSYDLAQKPYYPGFVGLNNIKANSYMNAILHALVHVIPLRDYFILDPSTSSSEATELVRRFSMLCRKVWNPRAFKSQVSPHELLQECANASGKRFKITEAGDPLEFLGWLLNTLHRDLGGNKKAKSSIIYSAFQGEVRVDDQQVLTTGEFGGKPRFDLDRDIKSTRSPFLFLAIDLPPPPVFQDSVETNIIPQVPISAVLAKYDGMTTQEAKGVIRRWKITRLPPFLILHMKRFTKNNFVEEKNPTIVNFPLRGVDMSDYVEPNASMTQYYDLVSNITHSSAAGTAREETTWKVHVHLRAQRDAAGRLARSGKGDDDEKWYEIQDLIVDEIQQQLISLGESYIQIWERRGAATEPLVVEKPNPKPPKI